MDSRARLVRVGEKAQTYKLLSPGVGRDPESQVWKNAEEFGAGYGGDYHTTYFPQASYYSTRGYYFFLNNAQKLDLTSQSGAFYSEINFTNTETEIMLLGKEQFTWNVIPEPDPLLAIRKFRSLFSQPKPLPEWVHDGVIIGLQGGTSRMLELKEFAQNHGVKVSGIWIQDWVGKFKTSFGSRLFWDWVWDEAWYPRLPEVIKELKEDGIRVLAYVTPHMRDDGKLFPIMQSKGFLAKDAEGNTHLQDFGEFNCATVDLSNPEAEEFYSEYIREIMVEKVGFSGWMADFGEYVSTDCVFPGAELSGLQVHNRFPVMWAKCTDKVVESTEGELD